jgi:hypothetical protein
MIAVSAKRVADKAGLHHLLNPRHISELAEALDRITQVATHLPANGKSGKHPPIAIARTSLGIQVSIGRVQIRESCLSHYTLSRRNNSMSLKTAQAIARLIRYLACSEGSCRIVEGKNGIFHVLISPV